MTYWQGPYRWVSTMLLIIVGFVSFDTLFQALSANPENLIAGFVGAVAAFFLAPFRDMFAAEQAYLLTALIAVLGYALAAAIIVSLTETIEAARRDRDAARARRQASSPATAPPAGREAAADPTEEPTQQL